MELDPRQHELWNNQEEVEKSVIMSKFFDALADQISQKFGLGENTNRTLDVVENGHTRHYGKLGDFANKFDQSSERRYLEEGYLRKDIFAADPKQLEILIQEPETTLLIKKKMFSSIAENYRPDLMDEDERLFYKCTKVLMDNKCKQIAAFERLSKIERVSTAVGEFDTQMMPLVMSLANQLQATSFSGGLLSPTNSKTNTSKLDDVIEKIRKVYAFSPSRSYTSWITDDKSLFKSELGEGTGVIELTNVTSINTTVSVNSSGSCNITISDPNQLMLITESDIEYALSDATNRNYNHKIFQLGKESAEQIINRNTKLLNDKRASRGASPIVFHTNPDTLVGERVVAIVDKVGEKINFTYDSAMGLGGIGVGNGVTVSDDSLIGGIILGTEGLNNASDKTIPGLSVKRAIGGSELSIFQDIVIATFNKLQMEGNSRSLAGFKEEKINYTRKKMRLWFLGKRIIQPMDQVHVYIGSKSRYDNKIISGLQQSFNAYGFLKNADNAVYNIKQSFDTLFNPSGNIDIQIEKAACVGPNFPDILWSMMRNQFVNERSGSHVFAGVVESVNGSYSQGSYSVSVSCKDNMAYFEQGFVNVKPSADVFNGVLKDPLTPFKTKFDSVSSNFSKEVPELLNENSQLLGLDLVKMKSGSGAGKTAKSDIKYDYNIDPKGNIRKVFHAPDGLVYRWKEGIGMFVQYGDSFSEHDPSRLGAQSITNDPFAGQDVMNVLSLLITGTPYNYATYYKSAIESSNLFKDQSTGEDSAYAFFSSLKRDLEKRNVLWGNFMPFKSLSMDEASFRKVIDTQLSYIRNNSNVNEKLIELQNVSNVLKSFNFKDYQNLTNSQRTNREKLLNLKATLHNELNSLASKTFESLSGSESLANSFSIAGDDISYDSDDVINQTSGNKSLTSENTRRKIRRKMNFLTRRPSWKVRANEDQNYFIVDDYYDKDFDILAFEKQLNNSLSLFNNSFITVAGKIKETAQLLSLEVFCDTQGHIRVRPPQYNKIPSSVFYKMLQLKSERNIQLFPEFLETLFVNQLDQMVKKIEICENEIRFLGAILGQNNDLSVLDMVNSGTKSSANGDATFQFISDENTFAILDIKDIIDNTDPLSKEDIFSQNIVKGKVFGPEQRARIVKDFLVKGDYENEPSTVVTTDRLNILRKQIITDSGSPMSIDDYLIKDGNGVISTSTTRFPDQAKIVSQISKLIADRQQLMKLAHSLLKNLKEAKSLDSGNKKVANSLFTPNLIKNNSFVPEIFETMVEDESYDDLGLDSGKRFIIKNSMIKSFNDFEQAPDYTMIEVQGLMDPGGFNLDLPSELNTFEKGNGLTTAAAVDYDMWRMYGYKQSNTVIAPYLHDPQAQCAPYAASLLAAARKNILRANLTISGNEYMQPGEVVFVEDRGLLYYVESVKHDFRYGSDFTTNLTLTYGHPPGEYITTPFDVIGKMMYSNKDNTSVIVKRQEPSANEENIGVVILDSLMDQSLQDANIKDVLFGGDSGSANEKTIANLIARTKTLLALSESKGSNQKASIELRLYFDSSNKTNPDLTEAADKLMAILVGEAGKTGGALNSTTKTIDDKNVNIISIQLGEDAPFNQKSPSNKAISAARNLSKRKGKESDTQSLALFKSLYSCIIDCWINIENITPENPGNKS